jgi:hypothetical protein
MVAHGISFVLADEAFPSEQIQRLRTELEKIDRDSASRTAMLGERAAFAYQTMFGTLDELREANQESHRSINGITDRPLREIRPGDCALLLELSSDIVDACSGEYPQLWRQQQALSARENALLAQEKNKMPWDVNIVTALLLPAHDAAFTAFARGAAEHRCTIVLLAAEQFRREQGGYPQRLEELTPAYLSVLPIDPYNGQPLHLLHIPGERFVIYSVGKNGQDDGGQVHTLGEPLDKGIAVPPFRDEPTQ